MEDSESNKNNHAQKCAWCDGTGNKALSQSYVVSCVVCSGIGIITTTEPAVRCPKCIGSGKRNTFDSCLSCSGRGWVKVFSPAA